MTFNFAPWAIDGARSGASLARLAAYAAGGRSGVIQPTDLRVSALAVPGNGLQISSGGAVVLNRYMSNPDQAYVVSNPAQHTVLAADMPPATAGTSYYLVCVVIGDPEFDQTGHPFMPSGDLTPEEAVDYEYVRVVIVPCPPTTTRFEQLGYDYPAYALARLEVPGSTTTITNAMITDLRELNTAQRSTELLIGRPSGQFNIDDAGGSWQNLGDFWPYVDIPEWATEMQILTHITAVGNSDDFIGDIRTSIIGHISGPVEIVDIDAAMARATLLTTVHVGVVGLGGESVQLKVEGRKSTTYASPGYIYVDGKSQFVFDVRFVENIV